MFFFVDYKTAHKNPLFLPAFSPVTATFERLYPEMSARHIFPKGSPCVQQNGQVST